jgi:hypothetical protein
LGSPIRKRKDGLRRRLHHVPYFVREEAEAAPLRLSNHHPGTPIPWPFRKAEETRQVNNRDRPATMQEDGDIGHW